MLDQRGDPENAMPAILLTLGLAVALIGCIVVDVLSARNPNEAGVPEGESDQMGLGEVAAMTSVLAAVLSWFPVLPVTTPFAYAAIATLAGLVALRHLRGHERMRHERALATIGALAGAANLLLRVVLALPS